MTQSRTRLVTSEMMQTGVTPQLFTGGACNIQGVDGPERNPGRDGLARWLDKMGWSYFDPQIHPSTHGRDYIWGVDGPQEKRAREQARLRVYEITSTTIAAITMLEIMDDARVGRNSIVWYHDGKSFAPIGLGDRDQIKNNHALRQHVGETVFHHLVAYVDAGRQLRYELPLMLADCPHIVFVNSFDELTKAVDFLINGRRRF